MPRQHRRELASAGAPDRCRTSSSLVAERGGTDLHITADSPPVMRINGELRPLPFPPLSANDTKKLCYSVLTEAQKHRFEEEQRARLLVRHPRPEPLSRQPLPAARRRRRRVPHHSLLGPAARRARPAAGGRRAHQAAARPGAGHRADRQRQVDHAGGDDRQDQQRAPRAHRDARGSDRVRAPAQAAASSTSARSTPTRTASTKRCGTCCARIPTSC